MTKQEFIKFVVTNYDANESQVALMLEKEIFDNTQYIQHTTKKDIPSAIDDCHGWVLQEPQSITALMIATYRPAFLYFNLLQPREKNLYQS